MPQRVISLETIRAGNRDRQRRCRERRQAAKAEAANTSTDMLSDSAANAMSVTSATTVVSITGYKSPVLTPNNRRTISKPALAVNDASLVNKMPRQAVSLETIRAGNRERQRRYRERRQAAKNEAANTSTNVLSNSAANAMSVTSTAAANSITGHELTLTSTDSRSVTPTPTSAVFSHVANATASPHNQNLPITPHGVPPIVFPSGSDPISTPVTAVVALQAPSMLRPRLILNC